MNGPPAKPIRGVGPSSATSAVTASVMKPTSPGSSGRSRSRSRGAADRLPDHRADAGLDVDVQPHRPQRDHDVAEQDGRVHRVPAHRLQGDLGDDIGLEHALSIGIPPRARRYSGSERPAWRINQTGV